MKDEDMRIDTALQIVMAAKDVEKISAQLHEQSQQIMAALTELHRHHKQLLNESGSILREQARLGMGAAMNEQLAILEKRITNLCERVDHTTLDIQKSAQAVKKQGKMAFWFILASTGLAVLAIIGFTQWYLK